MSYYYYQVTGGEEKWKTVSADNLQVTNGAMFRTILSLDTLIHEDMTREEIDNISYKGPLYFDLDDGDDPASTADDVLELVNKLENMDVNPNFIEIYASGGKGFHVFVSESLFAPKMPEKGMMFLPSIYREMAFVLAVRSMDFKVYSARRGRMLRQANVLRPSGLYKVRITPDEVREIAYADDPNGVYKRICSQPRSIYPIGAAGTPAAGLMSLFDQSRTKVTKVDKKKRRLGEIKLPEDTPSFDMLLDNFGIKEGVGFHALALQISITAHQKGWNLETLLEKAEGLIENHESDGRRYNTPSKRRKELERMYDYTEGNPCYDYSPGAIVSLLTHSAPDLHGLQVTKEDVEQLLESEGETATDSDYTKVLITREGSFAMTEEGPRKLTGMGYGEVRILKSLDTGQNLLVEADVYLEGKSVGTRPLDNEAWQSSSHLNKVAMGVGASFLGSDMQARGIYIRLNDVARRGGNVIFSTDREGVDWVKVPEHSSSDPREAGFFIWADNRTVVMPDNREDLKHINMTFNGFPEISGQFRTDLGEAPSIASWVEEEGNKESFRTWLEDMFNCQSPSILAKYLGWFTASHYRMMFHMTHKQFPLLHINGAAGQGKTQMTSLFAQQHFYKNEPKILSPSSTLFAITTAIAGSSSIPLVVDEFKPNDMTTTLYDRYRAMFRDAYNARDVTRGGGNRDNSDYRAMHRTKLSAPVVFISESMEDEPALMERVVLLTLKKPDILTTAKYRENFEKARAKSHYFGMIGKYIVTQIVKRYSLDDFDKEFGAILALTRKELLLQAGEEATLTEAEFRNKAMMRDRTVFNYAVVRFGLLKFFQVIHQMYGEDFEGYYKEMYTYADDSILDLQTQTVPEWLKILNTMAEMVAVPLNETYRLNAGVDFDVIEYNGKTCLEFNTSTIYFKYRQYAKAAGFRPFFPSLDAFKHAMNNVSMLETRYKVGTRVKGAGPNHVLGLDSLRAEGFIEPM